MGFGPGYGNKTIGQFKRRECDAVCAGLRRVDLVGPSALRSIIGRLPVCNSGEQLSSLNGQVRRWRMMAAEAHLCCFAIARGNPFGQPRVRGIGSATFVL